MYGIKYVLFLHISYDKCITNVCTRVHVGSIPKTYTGLSSGEHRVKVVPDINQCGRNRSSLSIKFIV